MSAIADAIGTLQRGVYEALVQPALYALGRVDLAEDAFEATEWFLLGVAELVLLIAILRPLESRFPVEHWRERSAVRVDVVYTLLHRLGLVPLALFLALTPLLDGAESTLRLAGVTPFDLERLLPFLDGAPLLSFLVYLIVLDLAEYWRHRLQHRLGWWWALHALHHSQRQMSFWTDNRNHLLDDLIGSVWVALVALVIGVPPAQFAALVIATRMIESLQHANLRLGFGPLGERLLVSPRFHRLHHAIGDGHEGRHRGCNFAVLLPVWDVAFGTARFDDRYVPTGVRDQLEGRDYGKGFWRQQWLGIRRLAEALLPRGEQRVDGGK